MHGAHQAAVAGVFGEAGGAGSCCLLVAPREKDSWIWGGA
jgi:hypothetical protein